MKTYKLKLCKLNEELFWIFILTTRPIPEPTITHEFGTVECELTH